MTVISAFSVGVGAEAARAATETSAPAQVLRVRPYNRVAEVTKITIADLVDVDGIDAATQRKLTKLSIGDAPQLGEQRVYSARVIAEALRESFNTKEWSVQIPSQVVVQNRGYELVSETVQTELLTKWQALCADCKIIIQGLQLPVLPVTLTNRPWKFEPITRLPRGHFSQKLIVVGVDSREQYFWVNGDMAIQQKVPVLNRSTPINTRLTVDDFKMQWRDMTLATDTTPLDKEIAGQQVRFTMNANDIIFRGSLVREKAVQRGEIVKVLVGEDQWQISTQAITQQDGFIGDTIRLKNLQTQKVITGRVTGLGEVEIR